MSYAIGECMQCKQDFDRRSRKEWRAPVVSKCHALVLVVWTVGNATVHILLKWFNLMSSRTDVGSFYASDLKHFF